LGTNSNWSCSTSTLETNINLSCSIGHTIALSIKYKRIVRFRMAPKGRLWIWIGIRLLTVRNMAALLKSGGWTSCQIYMYSKEQKLRIRRSQLKENVIEWHAHQIRQLWPSQWDWATCTMNKPVVSRKDNTQRIGRFTQNHWYSTYSLASWNIS
jgi:hypothetical protein